MRTLLLALAATLTFSTAAAQIAVAPSKDNTLYETAGGDRSNGAGEHLFAGHSAGVEDKSFRAVLAFDVVGQLPLDAALDSVQLRLHMSRTIAGEQTIRVHRLLSDWGEGDSDASANEGTGTAPDTDDATWLHTFFDTGFWETPGGDFEATASAEQQVDGEGTYTWSSPALTRDVLDWMENPDANFGWILIGNEAETSTAKRFDSRENGTEANRPQLILYSDDLTAREDHPERLTARLVGNHPNPFSAQTTITVALNQPQQIHLAVYDVLGRQVTTLLEGTYHGTQQVVFDAEALPAGVYFYRLQAQGRQQQKAMVVR